MRYILLVAWREFAESTKARGFWVSIFLFPTILFFSTQAPMWLEKKGTPVRYYVLVDQSGVFAPLVQSALEKAHQRQLLDALNDYARKYSAGSQAGTNFPPLPQSVEQLTNQGGREFFLAQLRPRLRADAPAFQPPRRAFQEVALPGELAGQTNLEALAENLKPYLCREKWLHLEGRDTELTAAILIPAEVESLIVRPGARPGSSPEVRRQIQYWSANPSETRLREEVERTVNAEVRRREYQARGLDSAAIQQVERTYAPVASLNPKKEKGREQVGSADFVRQWAPSGFVYLLWVAIFSISQMLLNNTIEEKSNRIIEVLLSSVTPGELMLGKLFGIAAVGLTMVGAWMAALFGMLSYKSGGAEITGQILMVLKTSNLVPLFSLYFLLGYLMYAAFILSIGSVCNSLKEAQSYMAVITTIMMVPLLTMTFIPRDPNGTVARVLSWIPLYTPFAMMNRAGADPPLVDLLGTLILLVATTAGAFWMSGKVFRIGILRAGQPPKLLEMIRWAVSKE